MNRQKKITIGSYAFAAFLLYVLGIWLCEAGNLFCYYTGLPQNTIILKILVVSILAGMVWCFKKRINVQTIGMTPVAWVILAVLLVMGFLKAMVPDTAFDTGNYHIVAQEPEFVNHFEKEIGCGNFQVWGFRLGDRLFSPFRAVLGYRLGTMLSVLVAMLMYIQILQILNMVCEKPFEKLKNNPDKISKFLAVTLLRPEIGALAAFAVHDVVLEISSYYVDYMMAPFILELLRIVTKKEKEQTASQMRYYVLLLGFVFAFKMTNIIYIIPFLLWYLWVYRKQLNIGIFVQCLLLGVIPCSVYLLFNYTCTGNPAYPYYNTIFHSSYYADADFRDTRWGPFTLQEKLLWPINLVFHNQERFSERPIGYTWGILLAYIVIIAVCVYAVVCLVRKKKIKNTVPLSWIFIAALSMAVWIMTTGYQRYFLFGNIMLMCILYTGIVAVVSIPGVVTRIVAGVMAVAMVALPYFELFHEFENNDWTYRSIRKENLVQQMPMLGKDRKNNVAGLFQEYDCFFITYPSNVSNAYLVRDGQKLISTTVYEIVPDGEKKEQIKKKIETILENSKKICDMDAPDMNDIAGYCERLNNYQMYIKSAKRINNGVNTNLVYELEKTDEEKNTAVYGSMLEKHILGEEKKFRTLAILKYDWGQGNEYYALGAKAIVNGKEEVVGGEFVPTDETKEIVFDFSKYEEGTEIYFETYYPNGDTVKPEDGQQVCLLNPTWE